MTDPAQYISGRTVEEQMNSLIAYVDTRAAEVATDAIASDMATLSQAVTDAESAKDDAEAARDTAVSTVSDCVKMHPDALQVIRDYPLQSVNGFVGSLVGNATSANSATSATTASKLGSSTVGGTKKPIYLNDGTATVCNEMCDITSAQTVTGVKTFSTSPIVPTVATGTSDTKAANGTKVKNELDAYSAMVRTTGNQGPITGIKNFLHIMQDGLEILLGSLGSPGKWYEIFNYPSGSAYQTVVLDITYVVLGSKLTGVVNTSTNGIGLRNVNESGTKTKLGIYDDGTKVHVYIMIPASTYAKVSMEAFGYGNFATPLYTKSTSVTALDSLDASATEVTY